MRRMVIVRGPFVSIVVYILVVFVLGMLIGLYIGQMVARSRGYV